MRKTHPSITPDELAHLKSKVEHTWGRTIKISADCEKLQQHMQQTIGAGISANTLRRIFGFLSGGGIPSLQTKNLLAQYCGYASWDHLQQPEVETTASNISDESMFFLDFFRIEVKSEGDINYHNACRSVAKRILGNATLFNRLAEPLAQNKTAQVFFYERFPYIDGLGLDYYLRGLRLYLHHKKTTEAQIFGHALLFLSHFLQNKKGEATAVYEQLLRIKPNASVHDFVQARNLGSRILYKKCMAKEPVETELEQVHQLAAKHPKPLQVAFWAFPYFQFMIADYLNLAGLYEESEKVVTPFRRLNGNTIFIEQGYGEAWEAIWQIALHKSQPTVFAHWFEHFDWDSLHYLFYRFYRLQAIRAYCSLPQAKHSKALREEQAALIKSTGFHFLKSSS
ncbi:hypothetical protein [Pseudocnuella soli]|uniref:hypothetical protein n=1 Tax=Pseudocnuella soli TaxID=2502779 RepID=UPI00104FD0DD|nr:hypothetical protein [Pseudocnuella soli]